MNRDDIIRMAREAGLTEFGGYTEQNIERFAALVAAAENEACAQIADVAEPYQAADLIRARSKDPMLFDDWGSIPYGGSK